MDMTGNVYQMAWVMQQPAQICRSFPALKALIRYCNLCSEKYHTLVDHNIPGQNIKSSPLFCPYKYKPSLTLYCLVVAYETSVI